MNECDFGNSHCVSFLGEGVLECHKCGSGGFVGVTKDGAVMVFSEDGAGVNDLGDALCGSLLVEGVLDCDECGNDVADSDFVGVLMDGVVFSEDGAGVNDFGDSHCGYFLGEGVSECDECSNDVADGDFVGVVKGGELKVFLEDGSGVNESVVDGEDLAIQGLDMDFEGDDPSTKDVRCPDLSENDSFSLSSPCGASAKYVNNAPPCILKRISGNVMLCHLKLIPGYDMIV